MEDIIRRAIAQHFRYDHTEEERMAEEILSSPCFYIPADPTDTGKGNSPSAYTENGYLNLFLNRSDADLFSSSRNIEANGRPAVTKAELGTMKDVIRRYVKEDKVSHIRAYIKSPVYVEFPAKTALLFGSGEENVSDSNELKDVSYVKEVLDTFSNEERSKFKDSATIQNIHDLLGRLLLKNEISKGEFDAEMDFTEGFTKKFVEDISGSNYNKDILQKILAYFGLEKYLYIYQKYSTSLLRELKDNPAIDAYGFRKASLQTVEPFTLNRIVRGVDRKNDAYVYRLEVSSKHRNFDFTVSNPFGLVLNGKYEIVGLDPIEEQPEEPEPPQPGIKKGW